MRRTITYRIDENELTAGRPSTCSEFLRRRGFSRHLLTYLRHHENTLLLNGASVFTNHPLKKGDVLEAIFTDEIPSVTIVPHPMELDIVYEDEDLLVINKPPYLPIQPSIGHYEYTLGNGVAAYYAAQGIPFVYRCVNRLDRNTSGLVIVAKNMASSAILYDEMKERRIKRTYLTVVHGRIAEPGTIDAPIKRRMESMIERCVDHEHGQRAVTHFSPVSYNPGNDTTALSVRLETGRTHQIRVHMAYVGHPVVGDTLYGTEDVQNTVQSSPSPVCSFSAPPERLRSGAHKESSVFEPGERMTQYNGQLVQNTVQSSPSPVCSFSAPPERLRSGAHKESSAFEPGERMTQYNKLIDRQALHSFRLEFMHPVTRQMLSFEAPLPEDIRKLLR